MEPTKDQAVFPVFQITRAFLSEIGFPDETVEILSDEEMQAVADAISSGTDHSDEAKKDTYISIQRAGFPLPETYKPFKAETEVKLNHYDWSVYGKLSDSVVVLGYHESYGQRLHAAFLSYKGGLWVELTKRNSTHKQLFERARLVAESTKRNGYYHIADYEQSQLSDSSLYPLIARMEAAVYDIQRGFTQEGREQ